MTEKKFREWIGKRIGINKTSSYKTLYKRWKTIMQYEEGLDSSMLSEKEFKKWINTQMMW